MQRLRSFLYSVKNFFSSPGLLRRLAISPLVLLINFYRYCISPFTPSSCRFTPTCSSYALEAFKTHGLFIGFYLTIKRISSCHPWGGSGYDPVPSKEEWASRKRKDKTTL